MSTERIEQIPLDQLRLDPDQPRQHIDEADLELLRESMAELGRTVQYITVLAEPDGGWRLLSGERRVRAARELGWSWLPAVVVDGQGDPPDRFLRQVAENAARSPLQPWELCQAIERMGADAGPSAIARSVGISVRTVHNYLTVLEHSDLVAALRDGRSLRSVLAAARDRAAADGPPGSPSASPSASPPRALRTARRATTTLLGTWATLTPADRVRLLALLRPLLDGDLDTAGEAPGEADRPHLNGSPPPAGDPDPTRHGGPTSSPGDADPPSQSGPTSSPGELPPRAPRLDWTPGPTR